MTEDSFKQTLSSLHSQLMGATRGYFASVEEQSDAIQDVLMRLWEMCADLRLPIAPLAFVMVRNEAVNRMRRKQREQRAITEMSLHADGNPQQDDRMDLTLQIIDTLPVLQRTILQLRHIDGKTMGDIAQLTGMSEGAIRQTLSRARRKVFQIYQSTSNKV